MQDTANHIAYAMNNKEATESLIHFNAPWNLLTPTHFAIEAILIIGIVLSIVHAFKFDKKEGGLGARLTLLNCFLYGLMMDILSYYTVENFWHGEFSVMFLYNRLPLYIALFYPAFMYHALMTIRRYEFPPVKEAIITGFFGGLMYLIFDNTGPALGWWIWDRTDITTFPYISSVPLTSYHWFFTFTGAFALINRWIIGLGKDAPFNAKQITAIATQPVLTILVGTIIFIPYNLFGQGMKEYAALYAILPWDKSLTIATVIHLVTFAGAGWLFLVNWHKPRFERDTLLMAFPFLYLVGHVFFQVYSYDFIYKANEEGLVDVYAQGNLVAVLVAMVLTAWILLISHPQKSTP